MPYTQEGRARIYYPGGRISKSDEVFFNLNMKLNRDVSVLTARAISEAHSLELSVIDAFSATGVRGIRYALECENVASVVFNDINPKATRLIRRNISLNKLYVDYEIHKKDARALFLEKRRQATLIDIDPFGSPANYVDCAAEAMSKFCILGVTATDTAPLCGTYPKVALRRYGTMTLRFDAMQEAGIRALISYIVRELAKHDVSFSPLVSLAKRHYFRIIGLAERNTNMANKSAELSSGFLNVCLKCGYRELTKMRVETCMYCGERTSSIHPVWIGTMFSREICKLAKEKAEDEDIYGEECLNIISTMVDEASINRVFYDLHFLAKRHKLSSMSSIDDVVRSLRESGFYACRTHIKSTAIRTDAPLKEILNALTYKKSSKKKD